MYIVWLVVRFLLEFVMLLDWLERWRYFGEIDFRIVVFYVVIMFGRYCGIVFVVM